MIASSNIISKNDVISSVRKHYCALGLGLELGLAKLRVRMFSVKRVFDQTKPKKIFHYTRRITPKRVTSWRCHLRVLAPKQHSYLRI